MDMTDPMIEEVALSVTDDTSGKKGEWSQNLVVFLVSQFDSNKQSDALSVRRRTCKKDSAQLDCTPLRISDTHGN
jgi:hypothetical protein